MFHDRECYRCLKTLPHRLRFIEDRTLAERQWSPVWRCTICTWEEHADIPKTEFVLSGGSYDGDSIEATHARLSQTDGARTGMTLTLAAKGNPHTTELYRINGYPSIINGGIIVRAEFVK